MSTQTIKDMTVEIVNLLRPRRVSLSKKRYGKFVLHPEIVQQSDALYLYADSAGSLLDPILTEKQMKVISCNQSQDILDNNILLGISSRYLESLKWILLEKITGIILELYGLDQLEKHAQIHDVLIHLQQSFVVTHVHGDNFDDTYSQYRIPKILHVTLIRKKLVGENLELDDAMYPTPYDLPCNPQVPDHELPHFGKNKFTVDWFTHQTPIWWPFVSPYINQECHYLEIGSFEGKSVSWMCRQILKHPSSRAYAVDTWEGSIEHDDAQKNGLMDRFLGSTHDVKDKIAMLRGFSSEVLKRQDVMARQYDIMYVDGDHHCWSALEDAILCFPLLKQGGLLIFDDYMYGTISAHTSPHMGINAFLHAYKEKVDVLHVGYQVFLRKK